MASIDDAIPIGGEPSDEAEHGMFPSAKEASVDANLMASTMGGEMVEHGEHGNFPSPMEAHGVEHTEHNPMCVDMVPILCEFESHLAHLSESESEMSDSTICDIECSFFEGMSDTPSELREVVDRSSEAIFISNNLPSTSSVFSHDMLGHMNQEGIRWFTDPLYQDDEDDATPWTHEALGHIEAPTTTTPTSHERYYKGIHTGVDDESVPLVDLHACDVVDISMTCHRCLIFPIVACILINTCSSKCVACNDDIDVCCVVTNSKNNFSFPMFVSNHNFALDILCYKCYIKSPIACNKSNNCSFQCFACNNTCHMLDNEIAPIAFSIFGDFDNCHDKHVPINSSHNCHAFNNNLLNANGDVQMKRCIMMDDVFIYHAHTFFVRSFMCVGTRTTMSTLSEHELTKRALESEPHVSSRSNPALIPFACFASKMLNNFSFPWFVCKHVDCILSPYDNHVPMILDNDALCVAQDMLNNCYFGRFVCNHIDILGMFCHECYKISPICVASNMLKNFSFLWFVRTHGYAFELICANHVSMKFPICDLCVATNMMTNCSFLWFVCTLDDDFDILPLVFLPISPLIASRMLTNFSFQCLECNEYNMFHNELVPIDLSHFLGVFVFSHLDDVENNCLHIDLAYALFLIYLCCANGVVNKNGHVNLDMILYHAQKYFAWSLLCEGTNAYSSTSTENALTKQASDNYIWMSFNELFGHPHFAKSFYLRNHAMNLKNWLLFECCFAFIVSIVGFMESDGTFKN